MIMNGDRLLKNELFVDSMIMNGDRLLKNELFVIQWLWW